MARATTEPVLTTTREPSPGRRVWGIMAGMAVGAPLSYLLCHGATLPGMLGLFFFILFGLVIGAAMFRVWAPLRPLAPRTIKAGVALATLVTWGGSLVWEGIVFPTDVADQAIEQVVKISGKTGRDVRAHAVQAAKEYLAEHHPPGGIIGYWRWAAAEEAINIDILGATHSKPIRYKGNGWVFIVRVILSGLALGLAMHLLVRPLSRLHPDDADGSAQPEAPSDEGRAERSPESTIDGAAST